MSALPTHARAVIIGGGIVGCSTAYHLTRLGWRDVLVLERAKLTSGSTFHAAGLVGQLRNNANITQLLKESVALYARLESETGVATGWKMHGGLRLACNDARMTELKRQATTAHSFGLEMHLLTPREAGELWPPMDTSDLVGAVFLPSDGQANPSDITQALARGARDGGARLIEDCPVTGMVVENGRLRGVDTARGRVTCEVAVNCAGQWAREVAALAHANVPLVSVQHQYLVTEPIPGLPRDLPTLRDPDRLTYFKEDVGGLALGGYEPDPRPWAVDGIPEGFHFSLLDADWEHFEPIMQAALARVPVLADTGVKQLINGPESFTPDGNFILGEMPECRGLYVGAGFNAFGIAGAGGAGKALAEWIVGGEPALDLWPVDIRRFGNHHRDLAWVRPRTLELYAKHYSIAWPGEEHSSARPLRTSALYPRLQNQRACFGEKMGWERPNWFAPEGVEPRDEYSFARPNWFEPVGIEHRNTRERVSLFDQSSFAKFLVRGRDAEQALSYLCANHVAREPGTVTYTQMLNQRGGIECDLTVSRFADDEFYLVTGTGFRTHDRSWIERHLDDTRAKATLADITQDYATLSLMGPASRAVLQSLCDDDLGDAAFGFARCRRLRAGGHDVRALRITYVGELGFELHFPIAHAGALYDALMAAGAAHGIRNAGYRAIESLRLEKGYLAWGADIGPDYTPLEAGLGWAVKLDGNLDFRGRDALLAQRQAPLARRLACFTVDDPAVALLGRETLYRNGERVGWLSSAGWGYSVGCNIGYGYVRRADGIAREYLANGDYALEVASRRIPCQIRFGALYDPAMSRVKG